MRVRDISASKRAVSVLAIILMVLGVIVAVSTGRIGALPVAQAQATPTPCEDATIWGQQGNSPYTIHEVRLNGTRTGRTIDSLGPPNRNGERRPIEGYDIAISPDNTRMYILEITGYIHELDVATGEHIRGIAPEYGVLWYRKRTYNSLSFGPDNNLYVGANRPTGAVSTNWEPIEDGGIWSVPLDQGDTPPVTTITPGSMERRFGWAGDFITLANGNLLGVFKRTNLVRNNQSGLAIAERNADGTFEEPRIVGEVRNPEGDIVEAWGATFANGVLYLGSSDSHWYRIDSLPDLSTPADTVFTAYRVGNPINTDYGASIWGATGAQESNAICSSPNIVMDKSGVNVATNSDGTMTARYTVTVRNDSGLEGTYGPVLDRPDFSSAVTVRDVTVNGAPPAKTDTDDQGNTRYYLTDENLNLSAGQTHTYTVEFTFTTSNPVEQPCAGPGTALFNNSSFLSDPNNREYTACLDIPSTVSSGIQVAKNPVTENAVRGQTYQYRVTVKNPGNTPQNSVVVTDIPQSGLDNVRISAPSVGTVNGLAWNVGTLAPGATATATVTGTVNADRVVRNVMHVASADLPTPTGGSIQTNNDNVDNDTDQRDETVTNRLLANVKVSKLSTSDIPTQMVGEQATYVVTVKNAGPAPATGVVVTDTAVKGLSDPTFSTPGKGTVNRAVWNVGTLAPNETSTALVTGTLTGGEAANRVAVAADDRPTPGGPIQRNNGNVDADNDQRDETPLATPLPANRRIQVAKRPVTASAVLGQTYEYRVTVKNAGNIAQDDVVVTDLPQSGLDGVTLSSPSVGTVDGLVWNVGTLAPGRTATITVTGTVNADRVVRNVMHVASADLPTPTGGTIQRNNNDVNADTDQRDETVTDRLSANVKVAKSPTSDIPTQFVGDTATYTVTVKNDGNAPATDVVVTDTAVSGLSGVALSGQSAGTVAGATWNVGDLAPGSTATVRVTGTLTGGDAVNRVSVSADGLPAPTDGPIQPNNDDVNADTDQRDVTPPQEPITPDARIQVAKNPITENAVKGRPYEYRVTVKNPGNVAQTGVVVTDIPQSGLDNVRLTAPSVGTVNGLAWNVGTLAPGATATVTVTGTVNADRVVRNVMHVASEDLPTPTGGTIQRNNTDVNADTDQRDETSTSRLLANVKVDKAATSGIPTQFVGDTATYTVTVKNAGPAPATGVVVTDLPRSGLSGVALSNPSAGTVNGLSWNVGDLAPGATATVRVTGTLTGGDAVNRVSVSADDLPTPGGTIQPNDGVDADTDQRDETPPQEPIVPNRLVQVAKNPVTEDAVRGQEYRYQVTVRNSGNVPETGVVVTDLPQSGLDGVRLTGPSTGTVNGLVWNVGDLAPGATATITVTGTVNSDRMIDNVMHVASDELPTPTDGPIQPNNDDVTEDTDQRDRAVTDRLLAELKIDKSSVGEISSQVTGQTATYTVTVKNSGPAPATGVIVTEDAVSGLSGVSFSDPQAGTVDETTWTVGDLAPGETVTATVTGTLTGEDVVNRVSASADDLPTPDGPIQPNDGVDGDTDQRDETSDGAPAEAVTNLQVLKETLTEEVRYGQEVQYRVTVRNSGNTPINGVTVTDTMVDGLSDATMSDPSVGTADGTTWTVGDLDPGQTETVTVTATAGMSGDAVNQVEATGDDLPVPGGPIQPNDGDIDNDTDQRDEVTDEILAPEVKVAKRIVSDMAELLPGDTVEYEITVANDGTADAENVEVTDTTVSGIEDLVLKDASTGEVADNVWTIETMAPGETATITATGTLTGGEAVNQVSVSAEDFPAPTDGPIQPNNDDVTADTDQRDEATGTPGEPTSPPTTPPTSNPTDPTTPTTPTTPPSTPTQPTSDPSTPPTSDPSSPTDDPATPTSGPTTPSSPAAPSSPTAAQPTPVDPPSATPTPVDSPKGPVVDTGGTVSQSWWANLVSLLH